MRSEFRVLLFFYPLMTPDITRRHATNLEDGKEMYHRRKGSRLARARRLSCRCPLKICEYSYSELIANKVSRSWQARHKQNRSEGSPKCGEPGAAFRLMKTGRRPNFNERDTRRKY